MPVADIIVTSPGGSHSSLSEVELWTKCLYETIDRILHATEDTRLHALHEQCPQDPHLGEGCLFVKAVALKSLMAVISGDIESQHGTEVLQEAANHSTEDFSRIWVSAATATEGEYEALSYHNYLTASDIASHKDILWREANDQKCMMTAMDDLDAALKGRSIAFRWGEVPDELRKKMMVVAQKQWWTRRDKNGSYSSIHVQQRRRDEAGDL